MFNSLNFIGLSSIEGLSGRGMFPRPMHGGGAGCMPSYDPPTRLRDSGILAISVKTGSQASLITSFRPTRLLILLALSCVVWAGIISAGFSWVFGISISGSWYLAVGVGAALVLGVAVLLNEILRAVHLPEDARPCEAEPWVSHCGCHFDPERTTHGAMSRRQMTADIRRTARGRRSPATVKQPLRPGRSR